jgi:hypothetical protein
MRTTPTILKQIYMLRFFGAYSEHFSHLLRIRSIAPIFGAAKDSALSLAQLCPSLFFPFISKQFHAYLPTVLLIKIKRLK